jgi:hypothetical protein
MKSARIFSIALLLVLGSVATSHAQDAYNKKLHEYLEAGGAMETFKAAIKQMMGSFRQSATTVPSEFWDEAEKEMLGTSLNELVDLLAPVYKKHLSEADLDELIKFYKSSIGKKLAEKTPLITQESIQAGQAWGQKLGQRIVDKLKEKGYN